MKQLLKVSMHQGGEEQRIWQKHMRKRLRKFGSGCKIRTPSFEAWKFFPTSLPEDRLRLLQFRRRTVPLSKEASTLGFLVAIRPKDISGELWCSWRVARGLEGRPKEDLRRSW